MATTIKRTTVSHTPSRGRIPPLPDQGRAPVQSRPEIEQPIYQPEAPPPDTDIEEGEAPVQTIETVGEEQLRRSREMQEMGIQNWVEAHDERKPENMNQQVAGVTQLER